MGMTSNGGGCLPSLEAAPPPGVVFFAIRPDIAGAARTHATAHRLRIELGLSAVPLEPERFHVSLLSIGHYPELRHEIVEAACDAAAALRQPAFDIVFDRAMSLSSARWKRPLVLVGDEGLADLRAFQQALVIEMMKAGFRFGRQPRFIPHMTLLYDQRQVLARPIAPLRWTVREFVLIHSHQGQSRHVPLARWPVAEGRTRPVSIGRDSFGHNPSGRAVGTGMPEPGSAPDSPDPAGSRATFGTIP